MTTALLARCPAPVAPLPPRGSGPTLPLSLPKTLQFSMPIDTWSVQWNPIKKRDTMKELQRADPQ